VLAVTIVLSVIVGVGLIDMYRLRHGPVAMLAAHGAAVSADVEIRADPDLVDAGAATPGAPS
jgi:hypothetical protein